MRWRGDAGRPEGRRRARRRRPHRRSPHSRPARGAAHAAHRSRAPHRHGEDASLLDRALRCFLARLPRLVVAGEVVELGSRISLRQVPPVRRNAGTATIMRELMRGELNVEHTRASTLTCLTGSDAGNVLPLAFDTMVLGRGDDCTIQVRDRAVSRRHARLVQREAGMWLEDLRGANGTYVNGPRVLRKTMLQPRRRHRAGPDAAALRRGKDRGEARAAEPAVGRHRRAALHRSPGDGQGASAAATGAPFAAAGSPSAFAGGAVAVIVATAAPALRLLLDSWPAGAHRRPRHGTRASSPTPRAHRCSEGQTRNTSPRCERS